MSRSDVYRRHRSEVTDMTGLTKTPFSGKSKKFVLTWIEPNFKTKAFAASGSKFLDSPLFETEDSVFQIRLIPSYIECPGWIACILTKDEITLPFAQYLVDCEVTLHNERWNLPEENFCFGKSKSMHVVLMKISDLRDNKFPTTCELTIKFGLRRCLLRRSLTNYASSTTELPIFFRTQTFDFPISNSSLTEKELPRNENMVNAENQIVQGNRSPSMKINFTNSDVPNAFEAFITARKISPFLRYRFDLVDVRKDIVVASKIVEEILLESEDFFVELFVPTNFLGEFENSLSASEALSINVSYALNTGNFVISNEKASAVSSYGTKGVIFKYKLDSMHPHRIRKSDFCITTEGHSFPVHRYILAARSPVFKAMLKSDMIESRTGSVEIIGMNSDVLSILLYYIYTSKFIKGIGNQKAILLYQAADTYDLQGLLRICRRELMRNTSLTNLVDLLVFSRLYRDKELVEFIRGFLRHWIFNSDVLSCMDNFITNVDRPLEEKDIKWMKDTCSFISMRNGKHT